MHTQGMLCRKPGSKEAWHGKLPGAGRPNQDHLILQLSDSDLREEAATRDLDLTARLETLSRPAAAARKPSKP